RDHDRRQRRTDHGMVKVVGKPGAFGTSELDRGDSSGRTQGRGALAGTGRLRPGADFIIPAAVDSHIRGVGFQPGRQSWAAAPSVPAHRDNFRDSVREWRGCGEGSSELRWKTGGT